MPAADLKGCSQLTWAQYHLARHSYQGCRDDRCCVSWLRPFARGVSQPPPSIFEHLGSRLPRTRSSAHGSLSLSKLHVPWLVPVLELFGLAR